MIIGTLRKTRRQRQRERPKRKGLISRTKAVHVHYNSWCISLPSFEKPQREMTKFCVVWSKPGGFIRQYKGYRGTCRGIGYGF